MKIIDREIITDFIHPPIPVRYFDYRAYYADEGEEAGRYGFGATEEAAIKELKQKFDWSESCALCDASFP